MAKEHGGGVETTGPRGVVALALAAGLLTGLGEAAMRVAQRATGRRTFLSEDVVWMAPVADVLAFLVVGGLLALGLAAAHRRLKLESAVWLFLSLALLGPAITHPRIHWLAFAVLVIGASRVVAPAIARRATPRVIKGTCAFSAAVVVLLTVALFGMRARAWSASEAARGAPAPDAPNVLLLVLDTVRSEDLSAYGYALRTTPTLERLAAEGVLFERPYSTAPWTLPSHASLFTGQYAGEAEADWETPLPPGETTLAEWLAGEGYATAGFVANLIYMTGELDIDRGFARYEDYPVSWQMIANSSLLVRKIVTQSMKLAGSSRKLVAKDATEMRRRVLEWIDETEPPFFAFANFMDAHAPYLPPAPFDTGFGPPRRGPALSDLSEREDWTAAELKAERAAYDGAIAYIDHEIGRLVEGLEERGILDRTVIVVTADHGEQFGEKSLVDHGNSLYRTSIEVPLLIRFPPSVPSGVRVAAPVTIRDVPRTLAALLGRPDAFPGVSLSGLWHAPGEGTGSRVLAEVTSGVRMPAWTPVARGDMTSLIAEGSHYIRNGDGVEELYDLTDRAHAHDLAAREPGRLGRMRAITDSLLTSGKE